MITDRDEYQGWSNAKTWCVALAIDNDKSLLTKALEICRKPNTDKDSHETDLFNLAVYWQPEIRAMAPWCWRDSVDLTHELYDVNWFELGNHYRTKVKEGC